MALFIGAIGMVFIAVIIWSLNKCIEITYALTVYMIEIGLFIALIVMYGKLLSNV